MRLVWAQYALDDRDTIFSYIEKENPMAAIHIDEEIVHAARRLLDFPKAVVQAGLPELGSSLLCARPASQPTS